MLWLINTTVCPSPFNRRTNANTCAVSRTPNAAVGSSMMMTSAFHRSARAIATACRCPPDNPSTTRPISTRSGDNRARYPAASRRIRPLSSNGHHRRVNSAPMNTFAAIDSRGASAKS